MKSFLQNIAEQYVDRYGSGLSDFTFVFPNKRSGTFFLRNLRNLAASPTLAPEVITISDLVGSLSDAVIDSRIDLLFTLYNSYLAVAAGCGRKSPVDFESFIGWADAIFQDFNEVDLYGVNPEALFSNVRDYRDIRSTFLTDGQLKVMEDYFGVISPDEHLDRFWKNYDYTSDSDDKRSTDVKSRFIYLWQMLAPLYKEFNSRLEARGLTYTGAAYRHAVERIQETGATRLNSKKIVFIGFNVLSRMEWLLFHELRKLPSPGYPDEPLADFLWDVAGPLLADDNASASRFVRRNLKSFPHPEWIDLSDSTPESLPDAITISASPSNVFQAKITGEKIEEICSDSKDAIGDAKIAVVLPDENLLLPMLNSLPESVSSANLTMGYPLRLTSTYGFIDRLKRLHAHITTVASCPAFFHEDIKMLLTHPFVRHLITTHGVENISDHLNRYRKFALTPEKLVELAPRAAQLFTILPPDSPASAVIDYIDRLLERLLSVLAKASAADDMVKYHLDSSHIKVYRDALQRLRVALQEHNIPMRPAMVFNLVDRLLAGETVRFEGEPLQGLQIMGLLETRSLDFDFLVIPSMNDRILPRRRRRRTFIPESLRRAFGLPSSGYEESIFAYYFYRLISRARKVHIIYDARSSEGKGGDISRYALQLKFLRAKNVVEEEYYRFVLHNTPAEGFSVDKSAAVRQRLKRFITPKGKKLSASALTTYCSCPMKFFFRYVLDLPEISEPSEFIDPLTQGTILHHVLQDLYLGHTPADDEENSRWNILPHPRYLTCQDLNDIKNDGERIREYITRYTNIYYFNAHNEDPLACSTPLSGEPAIMADMIYRDIVSTIEFDMKLAPVSIMAVELKDDVRLPVPDPSGNIMKVNMTFSIDRLDTVNIDGTPTVRVIDYKTGSSHTKADDMDAVFGGVYEAKNILQPLLYAHLYNLRLNGAVSGPGETPVRPEIYNVGKLSNPDDNLLVIRDLPAKQVGKSLDRDRTDGRILLHTDVADGFLPRLYGLINEIITSDTPFTCTTERRTCAYCPYKSFCHR